MAARSQATSLSSAAGVATAAAAEALGALEVLLGPEVGHGRDGVRGQRADALVGRDVVGGDGGNAQQIAHAVGVLLPREAPQRHDGRVARPLHVSPEVNVPPPVPATPDGVTPVPAAPGLPGMPPEPAAPGVPLPVPRAAPSIRPVQPRPARQTPSKQAVANHAAGLWSARLMGRSPSWKTRPGGAGPRPSALEEDLRSLEEVGPGTRAAGTRPVPGVSFPGQGMTNAPSRRMFLNLGVGALAMAGGARPGAAAALGGALYLQPLGPALGAADVAL